VFGILGLNYFEPGFREPGLNISYGVFVLIIDFDDLAVLSAHDVSERA